MASVQYQADSDQQYLGLVSLSVWTLSPRCREHQIPPKPIATLSQRQLNGLQVRVAVEEHLCSLDTQPAPDPSISPFFSSSHAGQVTRLSRGLGGSSGTLPDSCLVVPSKPSQHFVFFPQGALIIVSTSFTARCEAWRHILLLKKTDHRPKFILIHSPLLPAHSLSSAGSYPFVDPPHYHRHYMAPFRSPFPRPAPHPQLTGNPHHAAGNRQAANPVSDTLPFLQCPFLPSPSSPQVCYPPMSFHPDADPRQRRRMLIEWQRSCVTSIPLP